MNVQEEFTIEKKWIVTRYASDEDFKANIPSMVLDGKTGEHLPARSEIEGNLLLNEGIAELLDLLCSLGAPVAFSNANAYIGVGDSAAVEAATQTDLQAATNKLYRAMAATYPQRAAQTVTWRAVFVGADANYAWQEFSISNTSAGTGKNLNRKVSNQGTKTSGQTWTLDLQITIS